MWVILHLFVVVVYLYLDTCLSLGSFCVFNWARLNKNMNSHFVQRLWPVGSLFSLVNNLMTLLTFIFIPRDWFYTQNTYSITASAGLTQCYVYIMTPECTITHFQHTLIKVIIWQSTHLPVVFALQSPVLLTGLEAPAAFLIGNPQVLSSCSNSHRKHSHKNTLTSIF